MTTQLIILILFTIFILFVVVKAFNWIVVKPLKYSLLVIMAVLAGATYLYYF